MKPISSEVPAAVRGENVSFSHGKKKCPALDRVNITVPKGSIYALLGPSGCGKTTLLRCMVGCLKPEGKILVFGRSPGEKGFNIPGCGVGYMPQDIALYADITIEETLTFFAKLYRMNKKEIADRIHFLVSLLEIPSKKAVIRNLSGGQKRRVSFAVALIHKPPLLLLDEPTVGVDPVLRQSIWCYMKDLAEDDKMTIIVTTHYVEEARQGHKVGFMRDGRLLVQMNPEVLMKRYEASTLEQVFLRICRSTGNDGPNVVNDNLPSNQTVLLKSDTGNNESTDIWIPLEALEDEKHGETTDADIFIDEIDFKETSLYDQSLPERIVESLFRLTTLTVKSFVRLKRNTPLIFFEIFVPVVQVIVFCLCIGGEPFDLPLAVVNHEENSAFGQMFLNSLSNTTFKQIHFTDFDVAMKSARAGETLGVLHIASTFTESLIDRYLDGADVSNETITASEIYVFLDMTNQQIYSTIYTSIIQGFEKFSKDLLKEFGYNPRLADPPIVLKEPIYGSVDSSFTEFMVPGMIIGITYMMSLALTSMSIIIEKKDGLLERCLIAGVAPFEVVCSILLHLFVTMIFQIAIVLLITFLFFTIPILGSMTVAVICIILVGVSGMTYGLFVSAVCKDENSAMMVAMGSFYPNFLLSGIIWPLEAMPRYLRYFSYCLPMTLIAQTIRNILSKGWNITENQIWNGPLISIAWSVVLVIITCVIFKYKNPIN